MEIKPPVETLAGAIEVYDNVIDNCQEIIDILKKDNNWDEATITESSKIDKNVRNNNKISINQFSYETDIVFYNLSKTLWFYVNEYAKKYEVYFYATEQLEILKYEPGEFYIDHVDSSHDNSRVISAILYLNDIGKGGETHFTLFDEKIQPKMGRLVIFPSNYPYRHAALPTQDQTKYAVVAWMRG